MNGIQRVSLLSEIYQAIATVIEYLNRRSEVRKKPWIILGILTFNLGFACGDG
jgi:hypothetical protein